ncbi:MAG: hydrogenase maturation nickel metallochaperone HypA [Candidatus Sericytochromatia bacterium]|jgi:hydrogenase nickel incorporation protein HypA/HybF|nr:hydrogenase maturation nickel metallochaperone HypA [Candidatus Sericytochromatia bacterium]
MHEFSLLANLLRKIEDTAQRENASRVVSVSVKIGALAHISGSHFREHFEHAVRGTRCEGAELIIEEDSDPNAPDAQSILLIRIEVEDED